MSISRYINRNLMILAAEKQGGGNSSANGSDLVKKTFNETFNDFFNNRVCDGYVVG